jgi:hypothetical protein
MSAWRLGLEGDYGAPSAVSTFVLTRTETGKTLGVECKFQGGGGSAQEKGPATIQDIEAWPIAGVVAFGGDGFSTNMVAYFHSTGKAVA